MGATAGGPGGADERPPGAGSGADPPGAEPRSRSDEGSDPPPEARDSAIVQCPEGMHARPCHALVGLVREHASELRVECAGREVSGHSILELMTLAAGCGAELRFRARGPDAPQLVSRLVAFVRSGFVDRG